MRTETFCCHICQDPTMDAYLGKSFLPIGTYPEAKAHYLGIHNLFLPPTGGSYFISEEAWREYEARDAAREKERHEIESGDAILGLLQSAENDEKENGNDGSYQI